MNELSGRNRNLCFVIMFIVILCGCFYLYPFLAKNLNLFPSLETNEPLELSWVEGPLKNDVFKGVWYNESLMLELRNNSTENDYHIYNYILVSHGSIKLVRSDIDIAVSFFLEASDTWTAPESVLLNETSDILGNELLFGDFNLGDGIIHAKYSEPTWHWYFRLFIRISEDAPTGQWDVTIRVMGEAAS
jgi:hypothetical protein